MTLKPPLRQPPFTEEINDFLSRNPVFRESLLRLLEAKSVALQSSTTGKVEHGNVSIDGAGLFGTLSQNIGFGVYGSVADSNAISNTNALTPFSKTATLPAGAANYQGAAIRVYASGRYTAIVGAASVNLGIRIAGTTAFTTSQLPASGASNARWAAAMLMKVRTGGAVAQLQPGWGQGWVNQYSLGARILPFSVNLTVAQTIDVTWQWGETNAGDSAVMEDLFVFLPPLPAATS